MEPIQLSRNTRACGLTWDYMDKLNCTIQLVLLSIFEGDSLSGLFHSVPVILYISTSGGGRVWSALEVQ